jgi:hypothetical protein
MITRSKLLLLLSSIVAILCIPLSVEAWVAAGARGVAVGRYGAGCYHGAYGAVSWNRGIPVAYGNYGAGVVPYGAYGGTAAWNYRAGYAAGYRGPNAWSHGSGYAVDRFGGSYHGAYGRSVSWVR